MNKTVSCFWLMVISLGFCACQKPPMVSAAAEASSPSAMAPMGSETSNLEFQKRAQLLEQTLMGEAKGEDLDRVRIEKIAQTLGLKEEELKPETDPIQRKFLLATYYFSERRFPEASERLSRILDEKPMHAAARNLLARCFYFLGNSDRALLELDFILSHHPQKEEFLDALFLIGAISFESSDLSPEKVQKGKRAWEVYLKHVPKTELSDRIRDRLSKFEAQTQAEPKKSKSSPQAFASLKDKALQAFESGDYLLALSELKKAKDRYPKDLQIRLALARSYVQKRMVKEALLEFDQLLGLDSKYVPGWHYKGMAHMMASDPAQAIEAWKRVVTLDPSYADQFQLNGKIAIAQGMLTQGKNK